MRILAIRGENLASLGQPFSIDFDAEPLASTGLFAITGETGSGKSTILDALCLALYGEYPRFPHSQQDALPDPSGAKVSISDGSTILRRGTGCGHAEVEFIGQDNQRYRARWEARRSRKKPDGAIQAALRTLHVVHGATLTLVASSKTQVQRVVEAQTGLTFDQFCRTVLLPQGEFDAFLLAQKNDRGALLEKITGTEIYGRISKIVYDGARKLKAEAEQVETRLTNLGLLPPAERESFVQTVLELQQDVASRGAEQQALQGRIVQLDNIARAEERLAAAEQSHLDLLGEAKLAVAERNHLAELETAEPLRPLRDRLTLALIGQASAEQADVTAKSALQHALVDAQSASDTLQSARAAHEIAEQQFREFGPIWNEAARLDTEGTNAQAEATTARIAADAARAAVAKADAELGRLAAQITSTETEHRATAASLGERSHLLPLVAQLSNIEALSARYTSGRIEAAGLHEQQDRAEKSLTGLVEALATRDSEVDGESRALQQATDAALAIERELEESNEDKWQTEESELASLHRQARDAEQLAEGYESAAKLLHDARVEHEAAVIAIADASSRIESAKARLLELNDRRANVQRNAELADASLDQHNAQLRSLLVHGENCPICGATEHPYTAPDANDALTELAKKLREERSALEEALRLHNRQLQEVTTDLATANGQSDDASRNQARAASQMRAATEEFGRLREAMDLGCIRFAFSASLPVVLTEDTSAASLVSELLASVEERRTVASEQVAALKNLRHRLDDANKANREAQAAFNAATQLRDAERTSLHEARLTLASASNLANQADVRLTEIEQSLAPYLATVDISLELLRKDATDVLSMLRMAASEVENLRARAAESSAQAELLITKHKEQEGSRLHVAGRAEEADENLAQRNLVHRKLAESRAHLLGGEDTAQHRTRFNAERLSVQTHLHDAQIQESRSAANLATMTEQERSGANALANLLTEISRASDAYIEGCSSLAIELTKADELLGTSPTDTSALKAHIEAHDRQIRYAERAVADRQGDLQSLLVSAGDAADRVQLAADLVTLTAALNLSLQNVGDLTGRIRQDDALRLTAEELRREADEKAKELTTWQKVEDAIGSANGDRFRTFAQSLTLEQLVLLANEHLDSFSKRYQLARSPDADLSLHIIDNDMGEEHRAIRSLSGGERFIVALSLALSLSGLEGHDFSVDTLFIDEGFGALDADTLDVAITALESLHSRGRKVGIITHVAAMIESIPVQIKVEKLGGGSSVVSLHSAASCV